MLYVILIEIFLYVILVLFWYLLFFVLLFYNLDFFEVYIFVNLGFWEYFVKFSLDKFINGLSGFVSMEVWERKERIRSWKFFFGI